MKKIYSLLISYLIVSLTLSAQSVILSEDFEAGIPSTWTVIDADGDEFCWAKEVDQNKTFASSYSYKPYSNIPLSPDDWLITIVPPISWSVFVAS